jgi:hypothetical protein
VSRCRFYLGTHRPYWLWRPDVPPLFVSRRRLAEVKTLYRAVTPWALDSGGFTEIATYGRFETSPEAYVEEARLWQDGIGSMEWAAIQDWMCEPEMVAKSGLTVETHQYRTVDSFLYLRRLAPDVNWLPVIQGYTHAEYMRCVEMYGREGIDLRKFEAVGLGSVCRRQHTQVAEDVIRELSAFGIRLHAFGFKTQGLERCHHLLASADSMAWSREARWADPLPGCKHERCNNCIRWAIRWHDRLARRLRKQERRPKMEPLYA